MSVQSEAAELAAKAVAKGALHLIKWGKKIIPATADEIAEFGPNAARVKALLGMVDNMSDDAAKISSTSRYADLNYEATPKAVKSLQNARNRAGRVEEWNAGGSQAFNAAKKAGKYPAIYGAENAGYAEVMSDLIRPQVYRTLTNPMAVARRFDMTVPNAPESFTNIARSLGERSLLATPKDVELARRVSMLPPAMQRVYLDLVGEDTDITQLLQALRLMGQ